MVKAHVHVRKCSAAGQVPSRSRVPVRVLADTVGVIDVDHVVR